ncbi:MAG: formyltetrahydrofolate deformylase [Phycisphaerales bacterium]|nr:formyltetrahydrofolate deformylase [Phycisphaerae bacterium]NNF45016.1 formyltetrahydrofolate deformylase [Phycisphaerales bacterium]NNM26810.1 formyltetrahydrofolate deformylase [Phycisphaerales bacterium]
MPAPTGTARLLIACPDARGIVATVAGFITEHGGNLLESDQHTDTEHGEFFMRAEFELAGCDLDRASFPSRWSPIADRHRMNWRIYWSEDVKRMAILVSREPHCLQDLLWRQAAGELPVAVPLVISNHETLRGIAEAAGIPFRHCPLDPARRGEQEQRVRERLEEAGVDFVVLARYMQILSADFLTAFATPIINIHHSFLPAFAGGDPYRQAYDRGVKIIGATSHYVTEELDAGPIIAQEVTAVTHRHSIADLKRKGRDLERMVLARAVRRHVEDKVLVSKGKTVVFD